MRAQQARKAPSRRESATQARETGDPLARSLTARAEARRPVVRSLEYSHYPRKGAQESRFQGLSRDESSTGLCAVVDQPESRGSLLQVGVHDFDGDFCLEALALVAWCRARPDGRYAMGLNFLVNGARGAHPTRTQGEASWASGSIPEPI